LNIGLTDFSANSQQTRKEIDTMLRIMLDSAPNDPSSLPNPKRPRFLTNQLTLSSNYFFFHIHIRILFLDSLYSAEITEAATRSQYPPAAATANVSIIVTPNEHIVDHDSLPSYTDLFVVPSNCKEARRCPRFNNR
jgi:hypothetical protein